MEQDSEMMRLQLLGDPNLMRRIEEVQFSSFLRHRVSRAYQHQPHVDTARVGSRSSDRPIPFRRAPTTDARPARAGGTRTTA